MSGEILCRAAALMRARAQASIDADPTSDWYPFELSGGFARWAGPEDAEHIASWHPAVALAVADLLDGIAERWGEWQPPLEVVAKWAQAQNALAVARAYLDEYPCATCGASSPACEESPANCCDSCRATGGCTHTPPVAGPGWRGGKTAADGNALGVGIERVLADVDTDLTDNEVIKVRDDLLALFYGAMTDRIKAEVRATKSSPSLPRLCTACQEEAS